MTVRSEIGWAIIVLIIFESSRTKQILIKFNLSNCYFEGWQCQTEKSLIIMQKRFLPSVEMTKKSFYHKL
jgi:hypothetical protein